MPDKSIRKDPGWKLVSEEDVKTLWECGGCGGEETVFVLDLPEIGTPMCCDKEMEFNGIYVKKDAIK